MKRWATFWLLAVCLSATAAGYAADASPAGLGEKAPPLTLNKAIALALERNSELLVESLNSAISRQDVIGSKGIYDPLVSSYVSAGGSSLSAANSASITRAGSFSVTQLLPQGGDLTAGFQSGYTKSLEAFPGVPRTFYTTAATLTFTQPLLRNFGEEATNVNIILSKSNFQDSLERYRSFASDTVLEVSKAFFHLSSLRQSQEARKSSLALTQKIREEANQTRNDEPPDPMDKTNADYGVIQRLKDLVDAERNVRDQEAALLYLIGMTPKEELVTQPPDALEDKTGPVQDTVARALAKRSELKLLKSAYASSQLLTRTAQARMNPDVSLFAQGSLNGDGETSGETFRQMGNGQSTWTAGLMFSYAFLNRALESEYQKSRVREQQIGIQIEALKRKIQNDIEADYRALISTRIQLQVTAKALDQATQRLELYRIKKTTGNATTQDVLLAEADLSTAQSGRIDALENHADTLMKLWHDTGELLENMGVNLTVPTPPPD